MIVAQIEFQNHEDMVYLSKLIAYNDISEIPVSEVPESHVRGIFKNEDKVIFELGMSKGNAMVNRESNILAKKIKVSEVTTGNHLKFTSMYFSSTKNVWMTLSDMKKFDN